MTKWMGVGLLAVTLSIGCGKDVTKEIETLADRACACTDAACAEQVVADLVKFAKDNKQARGDQKRANAAGQKLGTCVIKAGADMKQFMAAMQELQKQ